MPNPVPDPTAALRELVEASEDVRLRFVDNWPANVDRFARALKAARATLEALEGERTCPECGERDEGNDAHDGECSQVFPYLTAAELATFEKLRPCFVEAWKREALEGGERVTLWWDTRFGIPMLPPPERPDREFDPPDGYEARQYVRLPDNQGAEERVAIDSNGVAHDHPDHEFDPDICRRCNQGADDE